jgi:hypothetical protein
MKTCSMKCFRHRFKYFLCVEYFWSLFLNAWKTKQIKNIKICNNVIIIIDKEVANGRKAVHPDPRNTHPQQVHSNPEIPAISNENKRSFVWAAPGKQLHIQAM